jgi:long-chain acyl-CoA synthetase
MMNRTTVVGFYDAMNSEAIDFIVKETELTTIFCSGNFVKRILSLKSEGLIKTVKNVVNFDEKPDQELYTAAEMNLIALYTWEQLQQEGAQADPKAYPCQEPKPDDTYLLSYTSGTTGEPKGVKLSHRNMLSGCKCYLPRMNVTNVSTTISYLPYTHAFE